MIEKRIFLILFLGGIISSFEAFAEDMSGSCGEHCSWSMDGNILKLTGYGHIDSQDLYSAPWYWNQSNITKIVIENTSDTQTFTSIGSRTFCAMTAVNEVVLPEGLQQIGYAAFHYAASLEKINLPSSLTYIESGAFNKTNIKDFILPAGVMLGSYVIFGNENLESVTVPSDVNLTEEMLQYTYNGNWHDLKLPETLKTVYCDLSNSSCQTLMNDVNLVSKIKPYTKEGEIYILGGKKYKNLSNMQKDISMKRIYTVDEAERVSKPTNNTFMVRYK